MCAFCFIISSIPTVKLEIIVDKSKKPHNMRLLTMGWIVGLEPTIFRTTI